MFQSFLIEPWRWEDKDRNYGYFFNKTLWRFRFVPGSVVCLVHAVAAQLEVGVGG